MIVRVVTAHVKPARHAQFNALVREQLPLLKAHEGLVYVKLARRLDDNDEEDVILFEEWRDYACMLAWTGPDISKARLFPGAERDLVDLRVDHFEALDMVPGEESD